MTIMVPPMERFFLCSCFVSQITVQWNISHTLKRRRRRKKQQQHIFNSIKAVRLVRERDLPHQDGKSAHAASKQHKYMSSKADNGNTIILCVNRKCNGRIYEQQQTMLETCKINNDYWKQFHVHIYSCKNLSFANNTKQISKHLR